MNSVLPPSISRLIRRSKRESTLTSSSTFTDIEKLVYEDSTLTRTTTTESRTIAGEASAQYADTPGYYSPGKVAEGYDQLSLDSTATLSRPASWNGEALTPPAAPFSGSRVSPESPTITVAIPSSENRARSARRNDRSMSLSFQTLRSPFISLVRSLLVPR